MTGARWTSHRYGYEKYAIHDDRGTEIGFCHRSSDARLIAAAPDMLEALQITTSMYEHATGFPMPSQAHRAIRRATGAA